MTPSNGDLEREFERLLRNPLTRRRILQRGAAGALSASALAYLAACGTDEPSGSGDEAKKEEVIPKGEIASSMYFANWPAYIDEEHTALKSFEKKNGTIPRPYSPAGLRLSVTTSAGAPSTLLASARWVGSRIGIWSAPAFRLVASVPAPVWMQVGEKDPHWDDPESTFHNWPMANARMAAALKAKGYTYRYVFSKDAVHVDPRAVAETLPGAIEWLWADYRR